MNGKIETPAAVSLSSEDLRVEPAARAEGPPPPRARQNFAGRLKLGTAIRPRC